MDDLNNKLMEMLNNPESMEKIKGLTKLLNLNSSDIKNEEPAKEEQNVEQEAPPALPADTIKTMMKLMPIISYMNKEDKNTKFLFALRPLLSDKRKHKLDESIKIMQMIRILPLLKNQGIF